MGKFNKFREYMNRPYSKGDYYGGVAAVLVLYGGLAAAYFVKKKLNEKKYADVEPEYVDDNTNTTDVCKAVDEAGEEAEA